MCGVLQGSVLRRWRTPRRDSSWLNSNKTELIWFGSRANLKRINEGDLSQQLQSVSIKQSVVWDLGVSLDSELTMHDHIFRTASTCFYHLLRLQLHRIISKAEMKRLVSAFMVSKLDYCSAVLACLLSSSLAPQLRVLHVAVRIMTCLCPRDHTTGMMMEIHWLLIEFRIKLKLSVILQDLTDLYSCSTVLKFLRYVVSFSFIYEICSISVCISFLEMTCIVLIRMKCCCCLFYLSKFVQQRKDKAHQLRAFC